MPRNDAGKQINRYHHHLTEETGLPNLDKPLQQTIALMKASDSWEEFDYLLKKAMGEPTQLELNLKKTNEISSGIRKQL